MGRSILLRSLVLLPSLVLLVGCLNTHQERVRVRRDPEIVEKEERRIRPSDYEDFLLRMQREREARRLTLALKNEENWYQDTRQRIAAITGVPEDPWAAYEKDRLDTLHRNWSDHDLPPPPPEKTVLEEAASAEDDEDGDQGDAEGDDGADEDEDDDEDDDEYDDDW